MVLDPEHSSLCDILRENEMKVDYPVIEKRLFIVGCPRSGTTLLQSMLMSNRQIHSFPETHFFDRGIRERHMRLVQDTIRSIYAWYILMKWINNLRKSGESVPFIFPGFGSRKMIQRFIGILDDLTMKNHKNIWVEKTPGHLKHIDLIRDSLPDAIFIHMIRDGRAVVASLYEVSEDWGLTPSIDKCIKRWNDSIAITRRYLSDPKHHLVIYDSLVARPEATLMTLCRQLEIDYDDNSMNYNQMAPFLITERETWKDNTAREISDHGLEKFSNVFSAQEQSYINENLDRQNYSSLMVNRNE